MLVAELILKTTKIHHTTTNYLDSKYMYYSICMWKDLKFTLQYHTHVLYMEIALMWIPHDSHVWISVFKIFHPKINVKGISSEMNMRNLCELHLWITSSFEIPGSATNVGIHFHVMWYRPSDLLSNWMLKLVQNPNIFSNSVGFCFLKISPNYNVYTS